eukprot:GDKJ01023977.1.p1 GENE.GDKJ01023977.1~~GDKJ01023977.1.p1  ORF type:complete len:376 (+),score=63.24 GDKJ01023977.1:51-1178(+)
MRLVGFFGVYVITFCLIILSCSGFPADQVREAAFSLSANVSRGNSADDVMKRAFESVENFKLRKKLAKQEKLNATAPVEEAAESVPPAENNEPPRISIVPIIFGRGSESAEPWIHMLVHVTAFTLFSISAITFAVLSGSYQGNGIIVFRLVALLSGLSAMSHGASFLLALLSPHTSPRALPFLETSISLPVFVCAVSYLTNAPRRLVAKLCLLGVLLGICSWVLTVPLSFERLQSLPTFFLCGGLTLIVAWAFVSILNSDAFKGEDGSVSARVNIILGVFTGSLFAHGIIWMIGHLPSARWLPWVMEELLHVVISVVERLVTGVLIVTSEEVSKFKRRSSPINSLSTQAQNAFGDRGRTTSPGVREPLLGNRAAD